MCTVVKVGYLTDAVGNSIIKQHLAKDYELTSDSAHESVALKLRRRCGFSVYWSCSTCFGMLTLTQAVKTKLRNIIIIIIIMKHLYTAIESEDTKVCQLIHVQ